MSTDITDVSSVLPLQSLTWGKMFLYLLSWRCCCLETTHTQRVPLRGGLFAWVFFFFPFFILGCSSVWIQGHFTIQRRVVLPLYTLPPVSKSFTQGLKCLVSLFNWGMHYISKVGITKAHSGSVFNRDVIFFLRGSFVRYATYAYGWTSTFPCASWNLVDRGQS